MEGSVSPTQLMDTPTEYIPETGAAGDERRGMQRYHPGLVLALPYLVLLAASLMTWIWRGLGVPGTVGGLSPPAAVLLALVVGGGFYAARRRLPLGLFTWLPAGLGAVATLTIGFVVREPDASAEPAALLAFLVVFGFVLLASISLARHSVHYGVAFGVLFLMTQATRIPVFEAEPVSAIDAASLLTLASAIRATLEVGVLIWLVYHLLMDAEAFPFRYGVLLWGLVLAHGLLSGWHEPLLRDDPMSFQAYGEAAGQWMISNSLLLGVITVFSRYRYRWAQESAAMAAERAKPKVPQEPDDEALREPSGAPRSEPSPDTPRRSGRHGLRSRRRRR